jgi:hypothetical protein
MIGIVFLGWEHQVNVTISLPLPLATNRAKRIKNYKKEKEPVASDGTLPIRLHGTDFHVSKKVWQECDGRRSGHEDE